jgi:hypothetical protein
MRRLLRVPEGMMKLSAHGWREYVGIEPTAARLAARHWI